MFDDTKKAGVAWHTGSSRESSYEYFSTSIAISTKTVVDTTSISLDSETSMNENKINSLES